MRLLHCETPLGLFSLLWALAASLHHLEAQPLAGLPLYPCALVLGFFPERLWAMALFAGAHTVLLAIDLPAAANHSVLALMVNAGLLLGGVSTLRSTSTETRRHQCWRSVRGPMQATVAVVYVWAIFHKLNSSFFDPDVSCAISQAAKMFTLHGLPEPATDTPLFSSLIYLTLLAEAAIVLCLLWPRWSHVGAMLGLLFHTALGWAQFFDFATVVLALYLFFLPWEDTQRNMDRIPRWAGTCFVVCLVALGATSFYFHGIRRMPVIFYGPAWSLRVDTLICLFWTLMLWPVLLPIFCRRTRWCRERRWTGAVLAWLIPLLALVNGATPYLGLKTVANYSMFSNLRTEGGQTNHFLIPAGQLFVADYQNDLVRLAIIDREAPERWPWWVRLAGGRRWVRRHSRWLADMPEARVPFVEVRRTLQVWRAIGFTDVALVYERQGVQYDIPDAFSDRELMRPLAFWERRLMAFRAVQDDGDASVCRW